MPSASVHGIKTHLVVKQVHLEDALVGVFACPRWRQTSFSTMRQRTIACNIRTVVSVAKQAPRARLRSKQVSLEPLLRKFVNQIRSAFWHALAVLAEADTTIEIRVDVHDEHAKRHASDHQAVEEQVDVCTSQNAHASHRVTHRNEG